MFKKGVVPSQGLRIIIVGCGKVGRTLVEQLGKEGHDITIVDKNRERISQVSNIYDVMGIAGNGASYKILQEAGIDDADLIIAVTGSDELNLLCCTIATQVGNCAAIARVRTPEYSQEAKYLRDKLGLALIINPELEAAIEMAHILHLPSSLEVTNFAQRVRHSSSSMRFPRAASSTEQSSWIWAPDTMPTYLSVQSREMMRSLSHQVILCSARAISCHLSANADIQRSFSATSESIHTA